MTLRKSRTPADGFTTKQVGERLGISPHTIRFYCNKGLVAHVRRSRNGYRLFTEQQVDWLKTLVCLSRCGFSVPEMKRYTGLCRNGVGTAPERKAMLETKKRQLWQKLEDIHSSIDFIERKQELFDQNLTTPTSEDGDWR